MCQEIVAGSCKYAAENELACLEMLRNSRASRSCLPMSANNPSC